MPVLISPFPGVHTSCQFSFHPFRMFTTHTCSFHPSQVFTGSAFLAAVITCLRRYEDDDEDDARSLSTFVSLAVIQRCTFAFIIVLLIDAFSVLTLYPATFASPSNTLATAANAGTGTYQCYVRGKFTHWRFCSPRSNPLGFPSGPFLVLCLNTFPFLSSLLSFSAGYVLEHRAFDRRTNALVDLLGIVSVPCVCGFPFEHCRISLVLPPLRLSLFFFTLQMLMLCSFFFRQRSLMTVLLEFGEVAVMFSYAVLVLVGLIITSTASQEKLPAVFGVIAVVSIFEVPFLLYGVQGNRNFFFTSLFFLCWFCCCLRFFLHLCVRVCVCVFFSFPCLSFSLYLFRCCSCVFLAL